MAYLSGDEDSLLNLVAALAPTSYALAPFISKPEHAIFGTTEINYSTGGADSPSTPLKNDTSSINIGTPILADIHRPSYPNGDYSYSILADGNLGGGNGANFEFMCRLLVYCLMISTY